ncbi:Nn.00g051090.m01.CDS01 [Neocucurbitaria sp. VM-36]
MSLPNPPGSKPPPTLTTLPSELRKVIVSHLAPDPEHLRPGCKRDLKNANLAHSCLREWVTEYMFRDMALPHVLPGTASQLEIFTVIPENARLIKYVKHIVVQVPPAIRWDVGVENPFSLHQEEHTAQRLCSKFHVKSPREMSDEQHEYCANYHRAMVEPFTDNRRWHQLFRAAKRSWAPILRAFTHLEALSVGCCERIHQPQYTYTSAFILQHGASAIEDVHPPFPEESAVNLACASAIIISSAAPPTVRTLNLSMANMDTLSSLATINRLLSLSYRQPPLNTTTTTTTNLSSSSSSPSSLRITKLSLCLRGIAGVHGTQDWLGDTGTAGSVRFWTGVLNGLQGLHYLEVRNALTADEDVQYSAAAENTDANACVLDWFLPGLTLAASQLRTLRLVDFTLDKDSVQSTLRVGEWPRLEVLVLDDIQLMLRERPRFVDAGGSLEGEMWLEVCVALASEHPGLRIELNRPVSNVAGIEGHRLHPRYVELIRGVPGVRVDV